MKKIILFALMFGVFAGLSQAQSVPHGDASIGYSYFRMGGSGGLNQNGVSGSVAFNANQWLGVVADIGGYHGSPAGASVNTYTFLFGPRFSYRSAGRIVPFAQTLFGGSHLTAAAGGFSGSSSPFAWSLGGGVDLPITARDTIALRPQVDYVGLHANGATTNCTRISVGLVFRFGQK